MVIKINIKENIAFYYNSTLFTNHFELFLFLYTGVLDVDMKGI